MRRRVRVAAWLAVAQAPGWFIILSFAQPAAVVAGQAAEPPAVLFSEGCDDPGLLRRGWYDGGRFAIAGAQPYAGSGCLEYTWKAGGTTPASSSGVRRLFEATDTVFVRCYIKLSKGWGWTGRP